MAGTAEITLHKKMEGRRRKQKTKQRDVQINRFSTEGKPMNTPDTHIPDLHQRLKDFARRTLALPPEAPLNIIPLTKGGSDRTFYRLTCKVDRNAGNAMDFGWEYSVIAMHYNPDNRENTLYAGIAGFLEELRVSAPTVLAHDPEACFIVMEDLGDEDLWSYRDENWMTRRDLYVRVLMHAHRLHRYFQDDKGVSLPELMDGYDVALYAWEREYFRKEFVQAVCNLSLSPAEEQALEEEGAGLAERLMKAGTGLVHRDLQSQNVMIHERAPVLIDFQGMRTGSPFYDLGSLFYDPYVSLTEDERMELLSFYYGLAPQDLAWPDFVTLFHEGSAQRLMQALGAYGFLGHRNGRADFMVHVPAGLRHLLDATSRTSSLPHLLSLTMRCLAALNL